MLARLGWLRNISILNLMTAIKPLFKLITLAIAFLFAVGLVTHFPTLPQARSQPSSSQTINNPWPNYEPDPRIGKPDRREGGGTRGPNIIALVPTSGSKKVYFGTTVSGYPTFVFYVTETKELDNATLEFVLEDSNQEVIYKTIFTHSGPGRTIGIKLPEYPKLPPLEENKYYYWAGTLILRSTEDPEVGESVPTKLVAGGWIKRDRLSPTVENQLKQATSAREKAKIYQQNLIWYDALNTLIEARQAKPNDSLLQSDWLELLQSAELQQRLPTSVIQGS